MLPSILEFGNDGLIVFDSFKVVIDDGNIGWFKFDDSVGQLIVWIIEGWVALVSCDGFNSDV